MTRLEIYFNAQRIARLTTTHIAIDPRSALYDMSVAELKINHWSGVVRRTATITLDPTNTTGQYALPADFLMNEAITWSAPPPNNAAWYPVHLWTPEKWRERQTYLVWPYPIPLISYPFNWPSGWPTSGELYAMEENGFLNLWPIFGIGQLNLTYKPILTPYSPSDPNWTAFGADPEAQMAVTGLDSIRMNLAIDGITRYVAAGMLRAMPGGEERYGREIAQHERAFEKSIGMVARTSVGEVNRTPQVLVPMGGLR